MSEGFNLSREARKAIFDGDAPRISGRGRCPAKLNEPYAISALVSLTVVKINTAPAQATDKDQLAHWWLKYEIHDRRDPALNMRRTPQAQDFDATKKSFDEYGYPPPYSQSVHDDAAEDSAYTGKATSLSDGGERVKPDDLNEFAKRNEARFRALKSDQHAHLEIDRLMRRIKHLKSRLRDGEPVLPMIEAVEAALDAEERKAA